MATTYDPPRYSIHEFLAAIDSSLFAPGPIVRWDTVKVASFEDYYQQRILSAQGDFVSYNLPYPKHELLMYLTDTQKVLLHGSNNTNISVFEPRQAIDATDSGTRAAVYAASDPIVPLWFATIDRTRSYGAQPFAISSLFSQQELPSGERHKVYYFAVSYHALQQAPWRKGAVYLLPRQSFTADVEDVQWLSTQSVKPLARIQIEPVDFPLREHVFGVDVAKIHVRMTQSLKGYPYLSEPDIHPIRPAL